MGFSPLSPPLSLSIHSIFYMQFTRPLNLALCTLYLYLYLYLQMYVRCKLSMHDSRLSLLHSIDSSARCSVHVFILCTPYSHEIRNKKKIYLHSTQQYTHLPLSLPVTNHTHHDPSPFTHMPSLRPVLHSYVGMEEAGVGVGWL